LIEVLRISHTAPSDDHPSASIQLTYIDQKSIYKSHYFIREQKKKIIYKFNNQKIFKNLTHNKSFILKLLNKLFINMNMFIYFSYKINKKKLIIHSHSINYLPFLMLCKFFFKKKICLTFGGTDFVKSKNNWLILYFLRYLDRIYVVSKNLEKDFIKLGFKNVINHENGVDARVFYNMNIERENLIIAIGNIRKIKGYEYTIDAFSEFFKSNNDYKLKIIGKIYNDDYFNKLNQLIKKNGMEKKIFFTDSLSHQEIAFELNKSKLLVLSSTSEGFPKIIIESIRCNTPVLSSNVGNAKEIISNCGLIIESRNALYISNSIKKILSNYNLYKYNCLNYAYNYSWNDFVKKIDSGYNKFLQKN
jgi:glycosyltransferase involved in cell wall biosynthesis